MKGYEGRMQTLDSDFVAAACYVASQQYQFKGHSQISKVSWLIHGFLFISYYYYLSVCYSQFHLDFFSFSISWITKYYLKMIVLGILFLNRLQVIKAIGYHILKVLSLNQVIICNILICIYLSIYLSIYKQCCILYHKDLFCALVYL